MKSNRLAERRFETRTYCYGSGARTEIVENPNYRRGMTQNNDSSKPGHNEARAQPVDLALPSRNDGNASAPTPLAVPESRPTMQELHRMLEGHRNEQLIPVSTPADKSESHTNYRDSLRRAFELQGEAQTNIEKVLADIAARDKENDQGKATAGPSARDLMPPPSLPGIHRNRSVNPSGRANAGPNRNNPQNNSASTNAEHNHCASRLTRGTHPDRVAQRARMDDLQIRPVSEIRTNPNSNFGRTTTSESLNRPGRGGTYGEINGTVGGSNVFPPAGASRRRSTANRGGARIAATTQQSDRRSSVSTMPQTGRANSVGGQGTGGRDGSNRDGSASNQQRRRDLGPMATLERNFSSLFKKTKK